jgi:soluble P-type ATPase
MLKIDIPCKELLQIKNLLLDYNGTLAIDGKLIDGVEEKINLLSLDLNIFVITADTFGTVEDNLNKSNCKIKILNEGNQDNQKADFIKELNPLYTLAVGNGFNDRLMLEKAVLGICILQKEGAAIQTLLKADIVVSSIIDVFDMLLTPKRMIATLRS